MGKSAEAFRTISEVAEWLGIPTHVLRFWESKFTQIKPVKRAGGRRYYRPNDMLLIGGIRKLLHEDGMTIKGAQKVLREKGVKYVASLSQELDTSTSGESAPPHNQDTVAPAALEDSNVVNFDQNTVDQSVSEEIFDDGEQTALNFWQDDDPNGASAHGDPIIATSAGLIAAIEQALPINEASDGPLHAICTELKIELARRSAAIQ